MKMIHILIFVLLSQINFQAFAQNKKETLNEFLILGTLNDYTGRTFDPREENLFDRYDPSEKAMKSIINSLIKTTYPKQVYQEMKTDASTISSNFLAIRFNGFYNYSKNGSFTLDGREILTGKLKDNIMQNEKEKLAFLTGAFIRFGSIRDSAYCISIANSLSKTKVCNDLLKELGCKPYYNIRKNYIPIGHDVFFHPTPKLLAYLKKYEKLYTRVGDSRKLFFQDMIDKSWGETKSKK